MGIILSRDLKPENSEHKSENNHVLSPEKVGDCVKERYQVFMKGGACKEAFMDCQDCIAEAEKKGESTGQCDSMLQKCMEAHSDYYQPILEAEKAALEVLMKAIMPSTDEVSQEEEAERFLAFLKGGGCKESYTAWDDCIEEADKDKEDFLTKCAGLSATLSKCIDAHSDYYQPLLAVKKTAEEQLDKGFKALFSER